MFEVGNAIGGALAFILLTLGILRARKKDEDEDDPHMGIGA